MPDQPTIPSPTAEDLARSLAADWATCQAAKRGPWRKDRTSGYDNFIIVSETEPPGQNGICSMWASGILSNDIRTHEGTWDFIAAARTGWEAALRLLHAANARADAAEQARQAAEAEVGRLKAELECERRMALDQYRSSPDSREL